MGAFLHPLRAQRGHLRAAGAGTSPASETRALESGAVDFVHKPVNKAVLRARIRLHRELVQAADQALAADCAKSAGLGKVGHELRTPMNHERGFTYLLRRELRSAREQELLAGVKAAQGHITLRVLLVGRHPHAASLRFDVQDQGIGLSAESQSRPSRFSSDAPGCRKR